MSLAPLVSVVVCTRNRRKALESLCMKSLKDLDYANFEVIVVNDGSTDGTAEMLKDFDKGTMRLKVLTNDRPRGLCRARNLGFRYSSGEIIAYIDDDCRADRDWLKDILSAYDDDEDIVAVGGRTYLADSDELFNPALISGCNMSFRRKALEIFTFDENINYHLASFDEYDVFDRIKKEGFKVVHSGKAVVRHFVETADYRKNVMGIRLNLLYVSVKHVSIFQYYVLLMLSPLFYVCDIFFGKQFRKAGAEMAGQVKAPKDLFAPYFWIIEILLAKKKMREIPIIIYLIIFEIPIKAAFSRLRERAMVKQNARISKT